MDADGSVTDRSVGGNDDGLLPRAVGRNDLGPVTWQAEPMAHFAEDLRFRGLVHQLTDPGLEQRLDSDRLTAYSGFDPTADSLHVGHLLQICNLRRLQLAGHRPIAVAGGGTGLVGDPGGKSEERSLLDHDELRSNLEGIRGQLERFLDFTGTSAETRALLVNNADWLEPMSLFEFLRDVGKHFTVNQMVAKDSVKSRLSRADQGISYTEFSYMLLQAYDFLHLFDAYGCRLQLGGSDQWGNITMGIELVRKVRQQEVWGLTTPLVVKADGTKFGKTESDAVWLDAERTSPYQLYQFFLRTEDAVVGTYLRYFTFLDHETILGLDEATAARPERREAHRELARRVCTLVHGSHETERAEQAAAALFSEDVARLDERSILDLFAEAPSTPFPRARLDRDGVALVDLLVETALAPSRGRARTTIEQGGAYVNNRREADVDRTVGVADLVAGRYLVLRSGKKNYHLVRFD
jgi:tyrosyl-tRNA synthetase